jgi:hypothetical protein
MIGISPKEAVNVSIFPSIYRVTSQSRGAEYVFPAILHSWGYISCYRMVGSLFLKGFPSLISENPSLKDLNGRGTYLA